MRVRGRRCWRVIAAGALLATGLAGCKSASIGATLTVTITDQGVTLSRNHVSNGQTSLNVNNYTGATRDLVIVRANNIQTLPLAGSHGLASSQLSFADKIDTFGPGLFHAISPQLAGGRYIIASEVLTTDSKGATRATFKPVDQQPLMVITKRVKGGNWF